MLLIQIIIILSLTITVVIGFVAGKKIRGTTERFFVAGRSLPIWLVGIALVAQAIDGNSTLANTSIAFDFGFWAGASLPIGLALSLFILGRWFAPKLQQMNLFTLADFFERKYDRRVSIIASILMLLTFGLLLAGNIAAVAALTQPFFQISYTSTVIIICLVVLLYSFRGGIFSDIYTDVFQIALLVVSIATVIGVLVWQHDVLAIFSGPDLAQNFTLTQLTTITNGGLVNWATIVALGFGNILAIDFAARIFSAKSPSVARRGCYIGGGLTLLFGIPFALLPVAIQHFGIQLVDGEPILMTFGMSMLPTVVYALLICGILAASLSTIDGAMLSMGNILTHNMLNLKMDLTADEPAEAERISLYFSRLTLIPIAFIAMTFAILLPSPGALLTVGFDIMFAALLVPFLGAFYNKQPNIQAAVAAIVTGALARLTFAALTPTAFGVPNNLFYLPNTLIPPEWDGLGTILAPLCAALAYGLAVVVQRFRPKKYDPAH